MCADAEILAILQCPLHLQLPSTGGSLQPPHQESPGQHDLGSICNTASPAEKRLQPPPSLQGLHTSGETPIAAAGLALQTTACSSHTSAAQLGPPSRQTTTGHQDCPAAPAVLCKQAPPTQLLPRQPLQHTLQQTRPDSSSAQQHAPRGSHQPLPLCPSPAAKAANGRTAYELTDASPGTAGLRFPSLLPVQRRVIIPDSFHTMPEYGRLWEAAIVEELNLRYISAAIASLKSPSRWHDRGTRCMAPYAMMQPHVKAGNAAAWDAHLTQPGRMDGLPTVA